MEPEPIFFVQGRDPVLPLTELKRVVLKQVEDYFERGFAPHQSRQPKLLWSIRQWMSLENMRRALFPQRPLHRKDIAPLSLKIKADELNQTELNQFGVIPSYSASTHLYVSLYVLPAPPDFARSASAHPEEYARTRPYIQASLLCRLRNGDPAYYAVIGAYGVTGSMVVALRSQGPVGYYHLAPSCWNGGREPLRTRSVRSMDGMKIYWPIQIREGDKVYDRTFVLSATVSVWEGWKGWVKNRSSDEHHATVYGEGAASEILSVLKGLP